MDTKRLKELTPPRRQLITIAPDASVEQALNCMRESKIHHLVVLKEGRYLGVVSASDLIAGQQGSNWFGALRSVPVAEVMKAQAPTIDEHTDVRTALSLMFKRGVTALPLTHEGKVCGIVTETDMLRVMEWLVDKALGVSSIQDRATDPMEENLAKALGDSEV